MTASPAPAPLEAGPAVDEAVEAALGALLRDRDVSEIDSLEGGMLQVVRRGRRERLDSLLEGPLFALLRDALAARAPDPAQGVAPAGVLRARLKGGHELGVGTLVDGRLALRITKAPSLDVRLEALVEEGLLPPGIPEELVAAVLAGGGLVVLGPSRAGRQRVVAAVVRALQARLSFFGVSSALAALLPVPAAAGGDASAAARLTLTRARDAVALGADALCAFELDGAELAALVRASPGVPLVASVAATSMDALAAALDGVPVVAAASHSAVVGHGPDGQPRLLELHGPPAAHPVALAASGASGDDDDDDDDRSGSRLPSIDEDAAAPREVSGLRARPLRTSIAASAAMVVVEEPGLPPLTALPAGWASDAPDDDPGWELAGAPVGEGSAPPTPGSFDAVLSAQKRRPSFAPRAPEPHPQAGALQGGAGATAKSRGLGVDPFGGLTFEPPPGGGDGPPEDET